MNMKIGKGGSSKFEGQGMIERKFEGDMDVIGKGERKRELCSP